MIMKIRLKIIFSNKNYRKLQQIDLMSYSFSCISRWYSVTFCLSVPEDSDSSRIFLSCSVIRSLILWRKNKEKQTMKNKCVFRVHYNGV